MEYFAHFGWSLVRWRTKSPSPTAQAFSRFAEVPLETSTLAA